MWFKYNTANTDILFIEKIKANGIDGQPQHCIKSPTCRIPESLQGHELSEKRVKKINKIGDQCSHLQWAKVIQ